MAVERNDTDDDESDEEASSASSAADDDDDVDEDDDASSYDKLYCAEIITTNLQSGPGMPTRQVYMGILNVTRLARSLVFKNVCCYYYHYCFCRNYSTT